MIGLPDFSLPTRRDLRQALLKEMSAATEAYVVKSSETGPRWAQAAKGYAALLRVHIFKENDILFRMAGEVLTPAEQGRPKVVKGRK